MMGGEGGLLRSTTYVYVYVYAYSCICISICICACIYVCIGARILPLARFQSDMFHCIAKVPVCPPIMMAVEFFGPCPKMQRQVLLLEGLE